jgi:hypothetical protein
MNRGPISKDGAPFRAKIVGHDWRGACNLCVGAEGYNLDSFVVVTCSEEEKHKFPVGTTFDLVKSGALFEIEEAACAVAREWSLIQRDAAYHVPPELSAALDRIERLTRGQR